MNSDTKHLLKMGAYFALFFLPFAWCLVGILSSLPISTMLISIPNQGGSMEPYGFGLIFTGIGAAFFGKELFDAVQDWRSTRRRRRQRQEIPK